MAQPSENLGKRPLPPPPTVPPTPQTIAQKNTQRQEDDDVTRVRMPGSMAPPPLNKKEPVATDTAPLPPFDLPDLGIPEFDEGEERAEPTQITDSPANQPPGRSNPHLPPPPKAPQGRSRLEIQATAMRAPTTMPMGIDRRQVGKGIATAPQGVATHRRVPPPPPYQGRSPEQPPLEELVRLAFDSGYSDVHLGVGEQIRMRDRGEMLILDQYPEIDLNTFMSWLREILSEDDIQKFKKELEYDGATQYDFARIRINVFDSLRGPSLVLRLIPLKILTIEQLRLPPVFKDVCDAHKGLILITGPTGSGKSTTLAAMIDHINTEQAKNIITIEDPVEFVHKSHKSLIKQREVGMHTLKFDNALRASLREDPDIILVGEMRDKETVNTALKAAQTGHLVMGTLHTNSAVKSLERIFTLYSAEEQSSIRSAIAESLVAIISQGLCRTTDGKRAAYHDILINTETVKDYILGDKYDEITMLMAEGEFDGMITMNQSLFNLYEEGRITEETALENSPSRNEMAMMLRGKI